MIREVDQYAGEAVERLVRAILFTPREKWSEDAIAAARADLKSEFATWESMIAGEYLAGALSAVDFTLFPYLGLVERMSTHKAGLVAPDLMGPKMSAWAQRMKGLPSVQRTWPPHWK